MGNSGRFKLFKFLNRVQYLFFNCLKMLEVISVLIVPLLWGRIVQELLYEKYSRLWNLVIIYVLIKLIQVVLNNFNQYYALRLKRSLEFKMKSKMMETELNLNFDSLQEINAGQYVSRFHSDVVEISQFWITVIPDILCSVVLICSICMFIMKQNVSVFFLTLGISIVSVYSNHFFGNKYSNKYAETRKIADHYFSMMYQTLNGIYEIKLQKIKDKVYQNNVEVFDDIKSEETKLYGIKYLSDFVLGSLDLILFTAVLGLSLVQLMNSEISIAYFISLFSYLPIISANIMSISKVIVNRKSYIISLERVSKLIRPSHNIDSFGSEFLEEDIYQISFEDVSYAYTNSKGDALSRVSLAISCGDKVALVGESGSGKTTLFRLLTGLIKPTHGKILLNSVDMNDLTENCIRSNIAFVSQNPFFLNLSILENLSIGSTNKRVEEIKGLLEKVGLNSFSNNLDFVISEKNENISGGEKQRLAIVRAILQERALTIYDEPFSAQDNKIIENTNELINEVSQDKILIVSSHRISCISNFNKIIVMKEGRVEVIGNHDDLMMKSEYYHQLVKKEMLQEHE